MSKHKSEVLAVTIQLKVKFPQADITKIRTRCFVKCSEQLYDGKLGTSASDIMYEKPLICVMGK